MDSRNFALPESQRWRGLQWAVGGNPALARVSAGLTISIQINRLRLAEEILQCSIF
jgi:hypothetical protein